MVEVSLSKRSLKVGAILLVLMLLLTGTVASRNYAHGGDTSLIHACVNNNSGTIQIVGANDPCNKGWSPLDWSGSSLAGQNCPSGGYVSGFDSSGNIVCAPLPTCDCGGGGAVCGNSVMETGETCDDGNTLNGDGCTSTCQLETPAAVCGNGIVEAGEQCDDGNTYPNDFCSSICTIEGPNCANSGIIFCDDGFACTIDYCDNGNCVSMPDPLAVEVCGDQIDNNCNYEVDEGCTP